MQNAKELKNKTSFQKIYFAKKILFFSEKIRVLEKQSKKFKYFNIDGI
jgi:hypothetical protein